MLSLPFSAPWTFPFYDETLENNNHGFKKWNNIISRNNYHVKTFSRGGSRTSATSKMGDFVIIVNGFQLLTIITKRSILDVATGLDPFLFSLLISRFANTKLKFQQQLKWRLIMSHSGSCGLRKFSKPSHSFCWRKQNGKMT